MGLIGDAIASLQTAADPAYRAGDKDDALELLRRMAALDPSNTPNRLKVAELLAQEGRKSEALTDYEAVAEELERRGEEEERIRVVERIVALDPERAPALREVARVKLAMNQFGAAQKLAEQLIASHAEDVDGYEILGHALLGAGETDRAQEVFRDLAERFRLRGDEDRARDLMQRFGGVEALSVDETEAPLETEDAPLDTEDGVLELDREIGADEFLLEEDAAIDADSLAPLSDEAPAAETPAATPIGKIEPVQVLAPKPPAVVQSSEPTADEALDAGEPTSDPEQLLAEATVYLRYGKHERAVGALREILASDPEHRAALEHLGEALTAQGDTANAATAWQRAAEAARGAGDVEDFERLRARLAEIDAGAAEALAGPAPTPDEVDVDLDFDLNAEPVPADDADIDAGAEAGDGSEAPALEAAEIEFSDEIDGLEPVSEKIAPAEEPVPVAEAEQAAVPDELAEPHDELAEPPDEDPTATTPAQLSEQLEEAEFYLEQGLLDEARDLYERILESAPAFGPDRI
jgi:tetratricopeptide (TPR) repeat protein